MTAAVPSDPLGGSAGQGPRSRHGVDRIFVITSNFLELSPARQPPPISRRVERESCVALVMIATDFVMLRLESRDQQRFQGSSCALVAD
jgi:hypothetical protein